MASINICPNKSHPEWKALVEHHNGDESKAYLDYYRAGLEIPSYPSYIPDSESVKKIRESLDPFFKKIGVDLKEVEQITDSNGNKIDALAAANILHKSLEVVKGLAKVDTLPEEAAHFFVQILRNNNSPLYKSLADEITDYDVFKEVQEEYGEIYKGNLDKIKDEAIGKVIAQSIVDKFEQSDKKSRIASWWNRVLNFIKEKLGLVDKEELEYQIIKANPFSKSADYILGRTPWGSLGIKSIFEEENPNVTDKDREVFYQLNNNKSLEDRIRTKYNIRETSNGKFEITEGDKTRTVANTVREKIKAISDKYDTRSEATKQKDQIKAIFGGKGHQDLSNIIQRLVAERDGKISPAKVISTNSAVYNTLESYGKSLLDTIPSDSRIITDVPLYDKKSDTAGKIDMLVLHSDNTVDLYDWKFTDFGKYKNISEFRANLYNEKLKELRNILKDNYGVTKFGKIRAIPIDAQFENQDLQSIKVGSNDIKNVEKDNEYLNPVPLNEEMTGDEKLDRVIETLLKKKEDLTKSRAPIDATPQQKALFNEKKFADLAKVQKAIRDIQLKHDLRQYVSIGLDTISDLASTPINQYSKENLLNMMQTMSFYGKDMLGLIKDAVSDFNADEKEGLNKLVTESQMWEADLKAEIGTRLLETSSYDLLEPQKETGYMSRLFRSISQQDHPIIKEFWNKLVLPAKQKTRESVNELNEKIKDSVAKIKKIFPGKTGGDLFDWMIDKSSNGELKIAAKYKPDFYNNLENLRNGIKDRTNVKENVQKLLKLGTFDEKSYQEAFDERVRTLEYIYRNDADKDEKISARIKSFRQENDNELGLANPRNPYFKLNERPELYTEKYAKIQSTPELKEFYDLWMENSKKFQDYIGQRELGGRFLWNVRNDLIDSFVENGWGAFTNMSSILDHLEAKSSDTLGMVDPNTGLPTYEIPAYYTQPELVEKDGKLVHDSKNQSKDLGKVLSLVSAMAYNHKYMSEIESDSKALGMLLEGQQSVQVDSQGNPIKNKLTGLAQKVIGSASTLDQYRDYMNYYLYGVRNKTKDLVFKLGDRNISSLAILNGVGKYFVGKTLAFNPTSIMAHIVRSDLNMRILGGMDRFFNGKEYNQSLLQLSTRDRKAYQLMAYFDLFNGQNFKRKAESLSSSFLSEYINYDHMFIGHEVTDRNIRNAILLSLMKSHTYDENSGRIVKMNDAREGTSLFNQINTDKGHLDLGNIPQEQLEAFRNKVLKLGDYALGNNTRDDIRLVNLTVMGRALMTFRNWIPNMVYARYGDLRFDEDLQTYELGRYRSFWNHVVSKHFLPNILDGLKMIGTFGYSKFGDSTIQTAKELYAEYMEKNPNSQMTEQEYIDLHLANMRGNMMETAIIAALIGGMMAIAPDKDKHEHLEQGSARKWWSYVVNRGFQDMSFFWSPVEFNKQIKNPIPLTNTYLSFYNFGKAYLHEGEQLLGGHPTKSKNEFRKANMEMIPGLAGFEGLLSYLQDDYNQKDK